MEEVSGLMSLFAMALAREAPKLHADGVQLHFVGDRLGLSEKLVAGIESAERATSSNSRLILNICFNYGGRWDIVQAAKQLAERGKPVTEESLGAVMAMAHVADPDLVIRTGAEQRISNFLLWQTAYSEFYFSDRLWPEFDEAELDMAIESYTKRQRRFGKTSDQVLPKTASPALS